jgi:hypothetical protein
MRNNSKLTDLLLISGAPGLILLALLFDTVLRSLVSQIGGEQLALNKTIVFLTPLFSLLLMLALVGLIWMMIANRVYGRGVPAAYTILGLALLYAAAILFVTPAPDSWYVLMIYLAPDTLSFQASAAVAALGLVTLWFWREPEDSQAQLKAEEDSVQEEVSI